jgi:hypothetical protein
MRLAPMIVGATIASLYGIFMYYVMPAAIVEGNAALLADVFLVIFIGYFLGLTILALNLQGLLLYLLQTILCCFEKRSMRSLISKNMTSHKKRNNLTAIIYSVTLSTVIFMLMQVRNEFALLSYMHRVSDCTFRISVKNEYAYYEVPLLDPAKV